LEGRIQLKGGEITTVTYCNENRHWFEIYTLLFRIERIQ